MPTRTELLPVAGRHLFTAIVLAALAAVGIGSPMAAQETEPESLDCAEIGVDDQRSPPAARQLYQEADRGLDDPPTAEHSEKLARVYLIAAGLD